MLLSNMFLSIFELRRFSVTINVFVLSVLSDSLLALAYLVTSDNVMRDAWCPFLEKIDSLHDLQL